MRIIARRAASMACELRREQVAQGHQANQVRVHLAGASFRRFTKTAVWKSETKLIGFHVEGGLSMPTWSWMAYDGGIDFLDLPPPWAECTGSQTPALPALPALPCFALHKTSPLDERQLVAADISRARGGIHIRVSAQIQARHLKLSQHFQRAEELAHPATVLETKSRQEEKTAAILAGHDNHKDKPSMSGDRHQTMPGPETTSRTNRASTARCIPYSRSIRARPIYSVKRKTNGRGWSRRGRLAGATLHDGSVVWGYLLRTSRGTSFTALCPESYGCSCD